MRHFVSEAFRRLARRWRKPVSLAASSLRIARLCRESADCMQHPDAASRLEGLSLLLRALEEQDGVRAELLESGQISPLESVNWRLAIQGARDRIRSAASQMAGGNA